MNAENRFVSALLVCMGIAGTMLPPEASAADASNGQSLYMANCAGCHGSNGISIMQQAPNLARFEMRNESDETLTEKIQSGSGSMPPYIGILNSSEILDVISYLRTFN
jgi:mono/diheme cytochrome c family protein